VLGGICAITEDGFGSGPYCPQRGCCYRHRILYEFTAVTHDTDQVSLAAFLVEVRRRAPQGMPLVSEAKQRDPFGAMITRIGSAADTMEHRVLARLLRSVVEEPITETKLRLTELAALSPAVLLLLSAFIDDYTSGRYDRATIRSALLSHKISTPSTGTDTTLG